jgi:D-galactarolactone cycloisomerase
MPTNHPVRITAIRLVHLKTLRSVGVLEPAWNVGGEMAFSVGGGSYLEIESDAGVTGIGPGMDSSLLGPVRAHLLGADPFAVEQHAATLRYYVGSLPYRGLAGVDIALWDLIGKLCGQPLYKLWGGSRDKIPAYASFVRLSTPEERADLALQLAEQGWQALKLRLHHQTMSEDIRTVEAVRRAVGERMTILVDANQAQSDGTWQPGVRWDFRRALETAHELERLGVGWLEEPLPRFAFADLAKLNQAVALPIAGGENNRGLHEFVQMVEDNVYDILQPESMVLNGITALRKLGVLAELHGKGICPHHGGRGLGTVAHLHLAATWSHCPYLELLHDPPIGSYEHGFAMLNEPLVVDDAGFVAVPQEPGLGVTINPDFIADD